MPGSPYRSHYGPIIVSDVGAVVQYILTYVPLRYTYLAQFGYSLPCPDTQYL